MNPKRIVIDGKVYNSADEMPPDVRQRYEEAMRGFKEFNTENIQGALTDIQNIFADKNNNGTPDIFEGAQTIKIGGNAKIVVNGQAYDRLEDLPPEYLAKYEQAMGRLDANRDGIPDFAEGFAQQQARQPSTLFAPSSTPQQQPHYDMSSTPVITPERSGGFLLIVGIGFVLLFCLSGAVSVWYFFLR